MSYQTTHVRVYFCELCNDKYYQMLFKWYVSLCASNILELFTMCTHTIHVLISGLVLPALITAWYLVTSFQLYLSLQYTLARSCDFCNFSECKVYYIIMTFILFASSPDTTPSMGLGSFVEYRWTARTVLSWWLSVTSCRRWRQPCPASSPSSMWRLMKEWLSVGPSCLLDWRIRIKSTHHNWYVCVVFMCACVLQCVLCIGVCDLFVCGVYVHM